MLETLSILAVVTTLAILLGFVTGYATAVYRKNRTKVLVKRPNRPAEAFYIKNTEEDTAEDRDKPFTARIISPTKQAENSLASLSDFAAEYPSTPRPPFPVKEQKEKPPQT
jgi:hypothetical protein